MSIKIKALTMLCGAAIGAGVLFGAPVAGADPGTAPGPAGTGDNWGQDVKDCNANSCYPGGTKRGPYVQDQARDGQTPGYGREIHDLANPGASDPKGGPLN